MRYQWPPPGLFFDPSQAGCWHSGWCSISTPLSVRSIFSIALFWYSFWIDSPMGSHPWDWNSTKARGWLRSACLLRLWQVSAALPRWLLPLIIIWCWLRAGVWIPSLQAKSQLLPVSINQVDQNGRPICLHVGDGCFLLQQRIKSLHRPVAHKANLINSLGLYR